MSLNEQENGLFLPKCKFQSLTRSYFHPLLKRCSVLSRAVSFLTQTALPAAVLLAFLCNRAAPAEPQRVREQSRAAQSARARGYGHERLGGAHGGRAVGFDARVLARTLVQNLNHGVLLDDLRVEVLDAALHVQAAAVGHENLLLFLLNARLHRGVVAAAGRVADHRR